MSPVIVLIGQILLVPAVLGIALGLGLAVTAIVRGNALGLEVVDALATAPMEFYARLGAARRVAWLLAGSGFALAVSSLVGGLLGFILVMRRKVWKCAACGAVLDRD